MVNIITRRKALQGIGASAASLILPSYSRSNNLEDRIISELDVLTPRARARIDGISKIILAQSDFNSTQYKINYANTSSKLELGSQPAAWFGGVYFHWFRSEGKESRDGQWYGPYAPLDGRSSWDGSVEFFERHSLLLMRAGFNFFFSQVAYGFDKEEVNHFRALKNLQNENHRLAVSTNSEKHYLSSKNVSFLDEDPRSLNNLRVAPFFEAATLPCYDCKQDFNHPKTIETISEHIEDWFTRFLSVMDVKDLATVDGKVLAGMWYIPGAENAKPGSFAFINERIKKKFGFECYWSTHEAWKKAGADEINGLFSKMQATEFNDQHSADLLVGYWPPVSDLARRFLKREGGATYVDALEFTLQKLNSEKRPRIIIVESINEFSEGSLILPCVSDLHYLLDSHRNLPPVYSDCFDKPCHPVQLVDRWSDLPHPESSFSYLSYTRDFARKARIHLIPK